MTSTTHKLMIPDSHLHFIQGYQEIEFKIFLFRMNEISVALL